MSASLPVAAARTARRVVVVELVGEGGHVFRGPALDLKRGAREIRVGDQDAQATSGEGYASRGYSAAIAAARSADTLKTAAMSGW